MRYAYDSNNGINYARFGNLVHISTPSLIAASSISGRTIPSGYRPRSFMTVTLNDMNLQFSNSGTITHYDGTAKNSYFGFSLFYMTSDAFPS